jgi:hypothetical protein
MDNYKIKSVKKYTNTSFVPIGPLLGTALRKLFLMNKELWEFRTILRNGSEGSIFHQAHMLMEGVVGTSSSGL